MFLVSQLIDLASWLGSPRFRQRVQLMRLERWRNYEREYYLLDHLVDPARAAIDVGASDGTFAGRMAQLCSRVHCFEPVPWLAEALRGKLPPSVVVHQCALSNHSGTDELRIPCCNGMALHAESTLETSNRLVEATSVQLVSCKLARLDDVVQEPVGFIKIDVEGHELAVLQGATAILRRHRPVLLLESERRHNPAAPDNVFRFLQDEGYAGVFIGDQGPRGLGAFRVEIDQRVDANGGLIRPYVNNFVFLPNR